MTRDHLEQLLKAQPFIPFEVRLSNGDVHQIRHPENAMLLRSVLIVGYPEADRAVDCTLHHIATAEKIHGSQHPVGDSDNGQTG